MSRTVPIITTDKARFHASAEGVLKIESGMCPYYVVHEEDEDCLVDMDDLLSGLEGRRVHIIVFAEP